MPINTEQNSASTPVVNASGASCTLPEDFLSLRDILAMILRHRRAIAVFVLLVTLAAGVFFITRPRQYKAEGYLQIIAPLSQEGRVDKELFETMIASHLQKVSSAYIARNVAVQLSDQGLKITPLELEKQIKITRPPKTDLIRLVAEALSSEKALLIVRLWVREYLASIQKNNIHAALSQARILLKQAQSDMMETQAKRDAMQAQVAQSAPLITLSRAVDDRQIWKDLTQQAAPDPEALKKLAAIHINGQEQSEEYINLKKAMLVTEQDLSAVKARRDLCQEVARILEARIGQNGSYQPDKAVLTNAVVSEAELYVNTVLKSTEIVQFGEPGLVASSRGALKKTGLVFMASLVIACMYAFVCEWGKGILSSR